ncbi:MAG: cytochrome c-type biogenesis protein CcmH, partial [Gammaproteobacteria bacterium]
AESDSDIAIDLKKVIFRDLKNGSSPQEIKNKLISIYGEGILFMPQNKISLFFLYAFPLLLTFIGFILLLKFLRK